MRQACIKNVRGKKYKKIKMCGQYLFRCTHNQVRVKPDVWRRRCYFLDKKEINKEKVFDITSQLKHDTQSRLAFIIFMLFFPRSESIPTCAGECGWKSGWKRACGLAAFMDNQDWAREGRCPAGRDEGQTRNTCREVLEAVSLPIKHILPTMSRPSEPEGRSISC